MVAVTVGLTGCATETPRDAWREFGCDTVGASLDQRSARDGGEFDVVVYGGTPSGAAAARAAAELGANVLIVSDSDLFGGAIANGLGATDVGAVEASVGLAKTYLDDVREYYGTDDLRTEPKVAECIVERWLDNPNIATMRGATLDRARVTDGLITAITFRTSKAGAARVTVRGADFIDASYAGDLMGASHVPTRLGMGDFYAYDEGDTATRTLSTYFSLSDPADVASADVAMSALPHVRRVATLDNVAELVTSGMPSFTYRLCITREKNNRLPFAQSPGYDDYAPAWRLFMRNFVGFTAQHEARVLDNGTVLTQLWRIARLPNGKFDLNAAPSSFTNFSIPRAYFDDARTRTEILATYRDYLQSFLWFVQHDPSVPEMERAALADFGLCADEFTTSDSWPANIYLREGRRLVGQRTLTANDILIPHITPDAVAVGSYAIDSKPTSFLWSNGTFARDRGEMIDVPIYEIPFTAMLPAHGPNNLIVSVGISASPLAFSSVRMEPQFLELGHAAGVAAALAAQSDHVLSGDLAPRVQRELARTGGFAGLASICATIDPGYTRC